MSKNPPKPIEVFFSYAHEDEDLRDELEKHLSILKWQGVITGWHDRRIGAGREWEGEIDKHLNTAHIILLLISADFLASDYCYDVEMKRAMKRHEAGEARVIPVILRPVDWKGAPFVKLQALPRDAKAVTEWPNRDKALLDVVRGIRAAVKELAGLSADLSSSIGTAALEVLKDSSANEESLKTLSESAEDTGPKKRVQIYLQGDFSSLSADRQSAAIAAFAAVMETSPQAITVYRVSEGSIVFDLAIPSDAVQRLRFLLQSNNAQLCRLGVEKIVLEAESGEIEEWVIKEGKFDLVASLEQEIPHPEELAAQAETARPPRHELLQRPLAKPRRLVNWVSGDVGRVFLSYSVSGDEGMFVHNVVEHLYQDLTANEYEVWGYERKSTLGEDFREKYRQVIQESNFFVVFCNEAARQSEYIKDEIKTAVDCIKTKAIKIIPVQLDKENPHPLLDQLYLPAIPYYDKERRNRVYLLHRLLTAMGAPLTTPPGDKFSALGQVWKVYQRDPMNYPIYNPDSIRLLGSEGSRMDIQTEGDFTYGSVQLEVESKWRTDTSVGFEKWYGRDRYSITLQGDGNVWVRWPGLLWGKSEHFPVANWRQIRQEPIVLRIDWGEIETAIFVNNTETCRTRTQIHRPLKLRMNADFSDYLVATSILWPEE